MTSINLLPHHDHTNGWLRILPPLPEARVLDHEIDADHVVVGAGFGGLAAARRLAELQPDASVALIEAGRVGNNAAGRCSGFIIDHAHNIRAKGFADDTDNARRGIELNRAGLNWLSEIVRREAIECDWEPIGKVHAAASGSGEAKLNSFARSLDAIDEEYSLLDEAGMAALFGTGFYRSGLLAPHTVLVQPAALVIGLGATMPPNVAVYEDSPVIGFDQGPPHRLTTERGAARTPSLVLAANGFGEGFGFFKNRLLPLITWGSMTRELTDAELARIGGAESYGIIPAHPAGTTVRRTRGRRILIRNQYTFSRRSDITKGKERVRRVHRSSFEARFPMLTDVEFEYTWGGALSLSRNGSGVCGEVAPGVHATMTYQGTGMAKGTISGKYLAESIAGEPPALLATLTQNKSPSRNFPEPFNGWGVRLNSRWRRWQAGSEE